jgi:hypothetical protein
MCGKIETGNIGVEDSTKNLSGLPIVDSERGEDIDLAPLKEFIEQNKKDLTTLGKYLVDVASASKISKHPKNIETITNTLVTQFQEVVKKYYPHILEESSDYKGLTCYYKSIGAATFLLKETEFKKGLDRNYYWGYCFAFDKVLTKLICTALQYGLIIGKPVIDFLLKVHGIDKKTRQLINQIVIRIADKIIYELEKYKKHDYGMIWFYFDRVDQFPHIFNKFDPKLQPPEPWHPSYYYPQADWEKKWPIN